MLILGIETSTPRSSVALTSRERVVASAALGVNRRHGEFVGPAIKFCLDQAGATMSDLTGVAVGLGPGLYTGLRVGIVTAQTIARVRNLPVVGLCGLDVLAFRNRHSRRLTCVALDARRGEAFWAFYRSSPGGVQRATELRVGAPTKLAGEIEAAGQEVLVVGDATERYREQLLAVDAELAGTETSRPEAADLTILARPRFEREETSRPEELTPIYLRQVDAKIGWETRGRLQGGASA